MTTTHSDVKQTQQTKSDAALSATKSDAALSATKSDPANYWIYDIETYPNAFTIAIARGDNSGGKWFEISTRRNMYKQLLQHLRHIHSEGGIMVGFNNVGFDYPVLHYILDDLRETATAKQIYDKAMEIINCQNRFEHVVPANKRLIPQMDLYLINHFDNRARSTSLKSIEVNMKADNVEDLPFEPGTVLKPEEIDKLIQYNIHDVRMTLKFFEECNDAINFRKKLSEQYKRDFSNHNDTKVGKDYFVMKLEESNPGSCYMSKGGKRTVRQTKRAQIALADVILPYVSFSMAPFAAVQEWMSQQIITETKGVFSDIPSGRLGNVAAHAEMKQKQKMFYKPLTDDDRKALDAQYAGWWLEEKMVGKEQRYVVKWDSAETLNVWVNGFKYDFGLGGLHGAVRNSIWESDDEWVICSDDVSSYYPNLSIQNKLYPEHLGEQFCDVYADVYNERKKYAKGTPENAVMKLALNGTYGASNDVFSPFYDPQFTMAITVNGQLLLCKLAEMLLQVPSVQIIMVNTDGLEYRVKREHLPAIADAKQAWMKMTKLELESTTYKRLCIRDVNNYIGQFENGKIKRKGAYEYENLGWHQNHSMLVVPKAAEHVLIYGGDAEAFITKHDDKYDFLMRAKVPRSSRLMYITGTDEDEQEERIQNITRYYVSTTGGKMVKVMPPIASKAKVATFYENEAGDVIRAVTPAEHRRAEKKGYVAKRTEDVPAEERRLGIHPDRLVSVCNNIRNFRWNIDYDFYFQMAQKLLLTSDCEGDMMPEVDNETDP